MATINDNNRIYVSQSELRQIAPRAVRVAARHASVLTIGLASAPLIERAEAFAAKYDQRDYAEVHRARVTREAEELTAETADALRALVPVLGLVLSFDAGTFLPHSTRPDAIVVSGKRFLDFVEEREEGLTEEANAAVEQLRDLTERTAARWAEARAARIDVQMQAQGVREAAAAFHAALVTFRRVLAVIHGRSHLDYQSLRYSRTRRDDEDAVEIQDDAPLEATSAENSADADRESGEFESVQAEAS